MKPAFFIPLLFQLSCTADTFNSNLPDGWVWDSGSDSNEIDAGQDAISNETGGEEKWEDVGKGDTGDSGDAGLDASKETGPTLISSVCGVSNSSGEFCGSLNCSTGTSVQSFADGYCQLAGFAKSKSYTTDTSASPVYCLWFGASESAPTSCSDVKGGSDAGMYGLSSVCYAVKDLVCE